MRRLPRRRSAPHLLSRTPPTIEAAPFWRDLKYIFVPESGGVPGSVVGGIRELITDSLPTSGGFLPVAERGGRAAESTSDGANFTQLVAPTSGPFSVFAHLVRRDGSTNIQSLFGNGALGAGGWTFQLNYGSGEIGFTRWGIADHPSSTLGPVANDYRGASSVALAYNGTTVRLMRDDRFQSIATGGLNAPSANNASIGRNAAGSNPLVNCAIHVLYCWTRLVDDVEFQMLDADPWLPIRPRVRNPAALASVGGGGGSRVFVPAFIG